MNTEYFDSLVISGGGSKGIVALGILYYHHCITKRLKLSHLKHVAGSSIGAVLATLLVCGYSPRTLYNRIKVILEKGDLFTFANSTDENTDSTNRTILESILGMYNSEAVMSLNMFEKYLTEMVIEILKVQTVPTFKELYSRTGIHLTICVSNVTTMKEMRVDHITEPDLSIVEAMKMSCSIPIIFQRMYYRGNCVADGGLTNNFPWNYIPRSGTEKGKTLGVLICNPFTENRAREISSVQICDERESFLNYMYNVMLLPMASLARLQRVGAYRSPSIKVVRAIWSKISVLRFALTPSEISEMFEYGIDAAHVEEITENIYIS